MSDKSTWWIATAIVALSGPLCGWYSGHVGFERGYAFGFKDGARDTMTNLTVTTSSGEYLPVNTRGVAKVSAADALLTARMKKLTKEIDAIMSSAQPIPAGPWPPCKITQRVMANCDFNGRDKDRLRWEINPKTGAWQGYPIPDTELARNVSRGK